MKLVAYADIHVPDFELTKVADAEVVVTLGDIDVQMLVRIARLYPNIPIYSVLGNHDMPDSIIRANNLLGEERIIDVTFKRVAYNGVTFTGISGSLKYKNTGIMFTQKEAKDWPLLSATVVLSHDCGYKWIKRNDKVHKGFKAISKYVKKSKPLYFIFGHHHQSTRFRKQATECICVYQIEEIEVDRHKCLYANMEG